MGVHRDVLATYAAYNEEFNDPVVVAIMTVAHFTNEVNQTLSAMDAPSSREIEDAVRGAMFGHGSASGSRTLGELQKEILEALSGRL